MRQLERIGLTLIVGAAFCGAAYGFQALSKEYIRINGRVVAIENTSSDAILGSDPVSEVYPGQQITLVAKRASNNSPVNVNWTPISASDGTFTTPLSNVSSLTYQSPSSITTQRPITLTATEPVSGRLLTKVLTLKPSTATVTVALAAGQTDIYQATATGISNWQWAITPSPSSAAPVGMIQDVAGNPNQRRYVPPARNYCVQPVTFTATAIDSGGSPAGAGFTTRSLAKYSLASPVPGFSTDIISGNSVELTATLEAYNCQQAAQWVWTGQNVESLGGGRYRFNAPAGVSSTTSFSLTATESNSGATGGITMRVLPVGGAVLSATPNPIRLGPGAGQAVTASVNASNPTYNWTAGANLNLSSTSGATVCASATSSATGSSTLTVGAPGSGAAGVTIPVTFVALGDTSGLQARVNMSPSGGALNLNAGVAFTATPANVCGTYPITWSVTRRNSSGTEVTPAGTINGGVYVPPSPQLADGELITVRAQLTGTNVFNTVGVVQSSAANSLTLTPNPLTISAGDSPVQLYATVTGTGIPAQPTSNWGVQPGGYGVAVSAAGILYPPSFIDVPSTTVL